VQQIIQAGADLVRLNFSHGNHTSHEEAYRRVRRIEAKLDKHIGIIADLQGPKIRTGQLRDGKPVALVPGEPFTITAEQVAGTAQRVSTTYQNLPVDVQPGDRILMDDGLLELKVVSCKNADVLCEVVIGGWLAEHKGINLPGVNVSAPALTAKDRSDLAFALRLGVDYVALSFVRSGVDVTVAKDTIASLDADTPVIAKLEKPEAMDDLARIIGTADGIMVARGDLGVELAPERVPMLQKHIIRQCAQQRKPVITATQMLDSMREHPRPTRAEASDVANAILDGTDAVMLSGETAVGKYPSEAVSMMRRIAQSAEEELFRGPHLRLASGGGEYLSFSDAVGRAAARIAEDLDTKAIVAFTQSGSTARLVSQCRPRVPILAATPLLATARRCTLYWGVRATVIEAVEDTEDMLEGIQRRVSEMELAQVGDVIVVTAGTLGRRGTTSMVKLQTIR